MSSGAVSSASAAICLTFSATSSAAREIDP
jgi:hypothetical protein